MTIEIKSVISKFSKELTTIGKVSPQSRRYPVELKKALAGLIEIGTSRQEISKYTGLNMITLANWHATYFQASSNETCFREISVIEDKLLPIDNYIIDRVIKSIYTGLQTFLL